MSRKLRVVSGPDTGKEFDLPASGTVRIGRAKDTLTALRDETVSRHHCQIEVTDARVLVTNASQSGTLVNNQLITEHELRDGEIIQLGETGNTRLVVEMPDIHEGPTVGGKGLGALLGNELKGLVGRTLGRYRLTEVLAEGASGVMFRARDTEQNRDAALKIFLPNPALTQIFQQLVPVQAIRHPNLAALYGTGTTDNYAWAALEYVEGTSLEKQFAQATLTGWIDWQQVLRYAIHLVGALEALHQRQVVHGGLTPGRILITRGSREAKLGGLWRARAIKDAQSSADLKDDLRQMAYVPPERARGGRTVTARGDIYSLGAVLYHLLAGRPPFESKDQGDLIRQIVQTQPPSPREFQCTMPEALAQTILRMLAKDPEDRYHSAGELLTALEGIRERPAGAVPSAPPAAIVPPRGINEHQPPAAPAAWPAPAPVAPVAPVAPAVVHGRALQPVPAPPAAPPAPVQPSEGMITARCACGRTLHARRQFAGTRVRCPACSHFLVLPGRATYTQLSPSSQTRLSIVSVPTHPVSWKTPAGQGGGTSFLHEFGRYLLLVLLLIGTLVISLSGVVCSYGPETSVSDKEKVAPAPGQPDGKQQPPRPK